MAANLAGREQTRPVAMSGDELKITNLSSTYGGETALTYKRAKQLDSPVGSRPGACRAVA